jgi:hypothetical protein
MYSGVDSMVADRTATSEATRRRTRYISKTALERSRRRLRSVTDLSVWLNQSYFSQ